MPEVVIRSFRREDRDRVRDIAWNTAFLGEPASAFFDDKEILTDFLTAYFTDYEPESCLVAEVEGRVIGYLVGTKNTVLLEEVCREKIVLHLLAKAWVRGTLLRRKNIIFLFHFVVNLLNGEFKMPDFSKDYPATLHINIEKGFRGLGIGSKLMAKYLEYLVKESISGVYLPTMSNEASLFFVRQGFSLLHKGQRSYFKYILHRKVPLYIYGKNLQQEIDN